MDIIKTMVKHIINHMDNHTLQALDMATNNQSNIYILFINQLLKGLMDLVIMVTILKLSIMDMHNTKDQVIFK